MALLVLVIALATRAFAETFRLSTTGTANQPTCEVHLAHDEQSPEIIKPCNAPLIVHSGSYDVWLEGPGFITPFRTAIRSGERTEYSLPVAQAAGVRVVMPADAVRAQLWSVDRREKDAQPTRAFYRTVYTTEAAFVQMPVGRVIGVAFDRDGRALAVSRPVVVTAERVAEVSLIPPNNRTDLVVVVNRPTELASTQPEQLRIHSDRAAEVLGSSADKVIGVWYGAEPGNVSVTLDSDQIRLAHSQVLLRADSVTLLHVQAVPLPNVRVSITASEDAIEGYALRLQVTDSDHRAIRDIPVRVGSTLVRSLPAAPLVFTVSIGDWQVRRDVDLSSGLDNIATFDLEPFTVTGIVTYGARQVRLRLLS